MGWEAGTCRAASAAQGRLTRVGSAAAATTLSTGSLISWHLRSSAGLAGVGWYGKRLGALEASRASSRLLPKEPGSRLSRKRCHTCHSASQRPGQVCGISLWPKSWAGEQRLGQNAGVEGEVRVLRPQIASLQKPEGPRGGLWTSAEEPWGFCL